MAILSGGDTSDIVSLAEAKDFLNITVSDYDAELTDFVTAASRMWVSKAGPVAGSPTYDERYDGGDSRIVLRNTPVQSITSVKESYGSTITYMLTEQEPDGTQFDAYGYSIDLTRGLLVRRVQGIEVPFSRGVQNIHVVYTAGYTTVPADIKLAVKLLISHMWMTQRGGAKRPGMGGQDDFTASSYLWPNRVLEILATYYVPGIA